jgi:hypothetical protein
MIASLPVYETARGGDFFRLWIWAGDSGTAAEASCKVN